MMDCGAERVVVGGLDASGGLDERTSKPCWRPLGPNPWFGIGPLTQVKRRNMTSTPS